jgi:hypothetical protein
LGHVLGDFFHKRIWSPWSLKEGIDSSLLEISAEEEDSQDFISKSSEKSFFLRNQGDQMCLRKNYPKCGPANFWLKLLNNFYRAVNKPKYLGYFGK